MGNQRAFEHLDVRPLAGRGQRRSEAAETVHTEDGRPVEVGNEETAGGVTEMMFDVVNLSPQGVLWHTERFVDEARGGLRLGPILQALTRQLGDAAEVGQGE